MDFCETGSLGQTSHFSLMLDRLPLLSQPATPSLKTWLLQKTSVRAEGEDTVLNKKKEIEGCTRKGKE